jgi:hypothetical protein
VADIIGSLWATWAWIFILMARKARTIWKGKKGE